MLSYQKKILSILIGTIKLQIFLQLKVRFPVQIRRQSNFFDCCLNCIINTLCAHTYSHARKYTHTYTNNWVWSWLSHHDGTTSLSNRMIIRFTCVSVNFEINPITGSEWYSTCEIWLQISKQTDKHRDRWI